MLHADHSSFSQEAGSWSFAPNLVALVLDFIVSMGLETQSPIEQSAVEQCLQIWRKGEGRSECRTRCWRTNAGLCDLVGSHLGLLSVSLQQGQALAAPNIGLPYMYQSQRSILKGVLLLGH